MPLLEQAVCECFCYDLRLGVYLQLDGKMIACAAGRSTAEGYYVTIVAVTADGGTERQLTSKRWFSTGHLVWLSDNSLLLSAAANMFSPRQVWYVSSSGEKTRQVTQDEHDYSSVTVTADGSRVTALQTARTMSFWVGSRENSPTNRRIATEVGYRNALEGFSWTPDGRLVFASKASGNPDIWMMQADGTGLTRLTSHEGVDFHPSVSPDGRYIVFSSDRAGALNIWRMSLEGRDPVRLTYGLEEYYPETSNDGAWVVYQHSNRIRKVPVEGGKSQVVVDRHSMRPTISPDSRQIAHFSMRDGKWGLELSSITDGSLLQRFVLTPSVNARVVKWTSDGEYLAYVAGTGGVSNIWIRPLSGSESRQFTDFTSERISYFAWSRDGKLACSRGTETSDVVALGGVITP